MHSSKGGSGRFRKCEISHIYLLVFVTLCFFVNSQADQSEHFEKATLCDAGERLGQGCMQMVSSRSAIDCAVQCASLANCTGYSLDQNHGCFLHIPCVYIVGCRTGSAHFSYFRKLAKVDPCKNGGLWSSGTDICECFSGWVGDRCQYYTRNCSDLILQEYTSGVHHVTMQLEESTEPFSVRCKLFYTKSQHLYLLKTDDIDNRNRTWDDYVNGFSGWIGLKNMKLILEGFCSECDVLLKIEFTSGSGGPLRWDYTHFRLGNDPNGYQLSYDSSTLTSLPSSMEESFGSVVDCFENLQGLSFSTHDQDGDGDATRNCARELGNGWWFPNCQDFCNLLGKLYDEDAPEPYGEEFIRLPGVDLRNLPYHVKELKLYLEEN